MTNVEDDNKELADNEICEGCLFNWFSDEEVSDYLKERYNKNINIYEVTKTFVEYKD